MSLMDQSKFQLRVSSLLGLVACIAVNLWLFRLGALWGILGLNVTKHVVIAVLCQAIGVDREVPGPPPEPVAVEPATTL